MDKVRFRFIVLPHSNELVASFHECKHGSPWPSWRPRAGAACGTVRRIRGTPRPRAGGNAHDPCMLCWRTPEMFEPHIHAFSPYISRGYADQKNSQPVNSEGFRLCSITEHNEVIGISKVEVVS